MNTLNVDVAILGAGTAGLNARRAAEKAGATALMIDPGPLGTTCARVGCMPSKLLIAAADAAHDAQNAGVFGVHPGPIEIDGAAVMKRVRDERDRFVGFVLRATHEHERNGRLLRGRGRFIGPHTLQVDEHTQVVFKAAVLATGTQPFVPPPFRGLGDVMMLNDHLFELQDLPSSVLVVGTGVIGLELGQALHRLGVRTTIVGRGNTVGPLSDVAIKSVARQVFAQELDVSFDYNFEGIERVKEGVRVRFDGREETFEKVLIAAGRRANLHTLGLERTGAVRDGEGFSADPLTGQIGGSHLFMAGDASGFRPLLHEAADEGRIAGENAGRFPEVRAHRRRAALAVVFSDPQIGLVGQRFCDLKGDAHRVGSIDYSDQGRSRVMNKHKGLVHIYGERANGTLVGAEMFGPRVEHTAHLLAWAIQQRMTVDEALEMPFYHPVIEEGIRTALQDLRANLRFGGPIEIPCEQDGPGS